MQIFKLNIVYFLVENVGRLLNADKLPRSHRQTKISRRDVIVTSIKLADDNSTERLERRLNLNTPLS